MPSVLVTAPSRLHLGFIDPRGSLGRRFGSLGIALDTPRVVLEARTTPALRVEVEGDPDGRVEPLLHDFLRHFDLNQGVSMRCREIIPAHVGLGSGTQLSLAVATAVARLFALDIPLGELARLTGRGKRSGIGVSAFAHGGFVLDGGKRKGAEIPTRVFRHPFPTEWRFVVVVPATGESLHGPDEEEAFLRMAAPSHEDVSSLCHLILMQLLPSLIEEDLQGFGQALTTIQRTVGGWFSAIQGGAFAAQGAWDILELMLSEGAVGVGQSSWGPTLYGLIGGPEEALHLEERLQQALHGWMKAAIFTTGANNRGATVELIDAL